MSHCKCTVNARSPFFTASITVHQNRPPRPCQVLCDWHAFQRWAWLSYLIHCGYRLENMGNTHSFCCWLTILFQNWITHVLWWIVFADHIIICWYSCCWLHILPSAMLILLIPDARAVKEVESSVQQMEWGVFPSVCCPASKMPPCHVYFARGNVEPMSAVHVWI